MRSLKVKTSLAELISIVEAEISNMEFSSSYFKDAFIALIIKDILTNCKATR